MASLRQNIGYHATMFSGHKGTAMIITPEQALLKAQDQFQQLLDFVRQAADEARGSIRWNGT